MTKEETLKLLNFLDSFYNQKFQYPKETKAKSKFMAVTWHDYLKDYPYKIVSAATKSLVAKKEWPPTPAEIVKEIRELQKTEEAKETWEEAWNQTLELIRRHGVQYGYKRIVSELSERALKAAKTLGGLSYIGGLTDAKLSYAQTRYKEIYNSLKDREEEKSALPPSQREEINKLAKSLNNSTPKIEGS